MNAKRYRLTAEVQATICEHIRMGVTPYIAAEACGIPRRVYELWIKFSESKRPTARFRAFGAAVMQARAQAMAWAQHAALRMALAGRTGTGREESAAATYGEVQ